MPYEREQPLKRPRPALLAVALAATALLAASGCGDISSLLNPAFVNTLTGEVFPLAPKPVNNLILVRVVNTTPQNLSFLVTVEQEITVTQGGITSTVVEPRTVELFTAPGSQANESGVLFECPVNRIGLGRNLNQPQSDAGIFVGSVAAGEQGFGVPGNVNPLDSDPQFNDFQCGDTIIFQAIIDRDSVGGFKVQSFVLPWNLQPDVTVSNTFGAVRTFLDEGS